MLGLENGTIRRCALVGGSVSLWRWAMRPPPNHVGVRRRCRTLSSSCTMPAWMLPCSHFDDNGLNL
ncbi:mCG147150 [Mus musculus]|nr:mCG147150 [Mus musculus]